MTEKIVHDPYFSTNSILVVTDSGKLNIFYTPFTALCIESTGSIHWNSWVQVEGVYTTEKQKLIYGINGRYYFHFHFEIFFP